MSMVKSTKRLTNFDEVSKEINKLIDAVNTAQQSVGYGATGKIGDIRITGDDDNKIYFEALTDKGWYTTFTDVMVPKPVKGRPHPKFSKLEVDEFTVNKLLARKLNASNGDYIFSDNVEVGILVGLNAFYPKRRSEDINSTPPFAVDDLIITEIYDYSNVGSSYRYVKAEIDSIDAGGLIHITYVSTDKFEVGDTVVRVGNKTDSSRQDSIFISTSKPYTPYIDVYDNIIGFVGSGSAYWDNHIPEVRIGNLAGITDADFGALSGYGIYAQNIYMKGNILIDNPEDNGINTVYRQSSAPTGDLKVNDIWIDTDDKFLVYTWNGSSWIAGIPGIGSSTSGLNINGSYLGYYNGINWKTYMDNAGNFLLDGAGGVGDGYLQWTAATSTLSIKGSIEILNPEDINLSDINVDLTLTQSFYGSTEPTVLGDNLKVGDFWFDSTSGVYRMKRCATITPSVTWSVIGAYIDSSGLYAGTITAGQITTGSLTGQTLTGGIIQTASSGQRITINETANTINFYNSTTLVAGLYGGTITGYGDYLLSSGNFGVLGNLTLASGGVINAATIPSGLEIAPNAAGSDIWWSIDGDLSLTNNIIAWGSKVVDIPSSGYLHYNGIKFVWDTPTLSESDPVYTASSWYTTTNNASNWNDAYGWVNLWGGNAFNWDAAYGWGNHASAGYLTSSTEGWRTTDVTSLGNGIGNNSGQLYMKASNGLGFSGGDLVIDYTGGQSASGSTKGFLTNTDWSIFNNKLGQSDISTGTSGAPDLYAASSSGGSPTVRMSARTLTIGTTTITYYTPNP